MVLIAFKLIGTLFLSILICILHNPFVFKTKNHSKYHIYNSIVLLKLLKLLFEL